MNKRIIIGIALILVATLGVFALITNNASNDESSSTQEQSDQISQQDSDTEAASTNNTAEVKEDAEPVPTKTESESNQSETETAISISGLRVEDNALIIQTQLNDITQGVCAVTVSQNDTKVLKEAEVVFAPNNSFCAGFSISLDELPSGNVSVDLQVSNDSGVSSAQTKEITL